MTSSVFHELPTELVVAIFVHLGLVELLRCKRTCKRFCAIVEQSVALQYQIELETEGLKDVSPVLSVDEKLRRLEDYRRFWRFEEIGKPVDIRFGYERDSCWALTPTVIAFCSRYSEVTFFQVPSKVLGLPQRVWKVQLPFRVQCIDLGQTQRLLVAVSKRQEDAGKPDPPVWVVLLLDSETGLPHPRAKQGSIIIESRPGQMFPKYRTDISSKLVGITVLGLRLWVMRWDTGELLLMKDSNLNRSQGFAFLDGRYVIWPTVSLLPESNQIVNKLAFYDCLSPAAASNTGRSQHLRSHDDGGYVVSLILPDPVNSKITEGRERLVLCMKDRQLFPEILAQPFVRTEDSGVLAIPMLVKLLNSNLLKRYLMVVPRRTLRNAIQRATAPRASHNSVERRGTADLAWQQWGANVRVLSAPRNHYFASTAENRGTRVHVAEREGGIPPEVRCTRRAIYDFNPRPLQRDPRAVHPDPESACEGGGWKEESWGYSPDVVQGVLQTLPYRRTLFPPEMCEDGVEELDGQCPTSMLGDYFFGLRIEDHNSFTYRIWSVWTVLLAVQYKIGSRNPSLYLDTWMSWVAI